MPTLWTNASTPPSLHRPIPTDNDPLPYSTAASPRVSSPCSFGALPPLFFSPRKNVTSAMLALRSGRGAFLWVTIALHVIAAALFWRHIHHVPFSLVHVPDMARVEDVQLARTAWSHHFLSTLADFGGAQLQPAQGNTGDLQGGGLCIVWIALNRRPGHHIVNSVASVLHGGGLSGRLPRRGARFAEGVSAFALVRRHPGDALSADVRLLAMAGIEVVSEAVGCTGHCSWTSQGNADYRRALETCLQRTSAALCLVLEEDTWATPDFLPKLRRAVRHATASSEGRWAAGDRREAGSARQSPAWFDIKLFVTAYYDGWSAEAGSVLELCAWALALGAAYTGLAWWCARRAGWLVRGTRDSSEDTVTAGFVREVIVDDSLPRNHGAKMQGGARSWHRRWPGWRALLAGFVVFALATGCAIAGLLLHGRQGLPIGALTRRGVRAHDIAVSTLGILFHRESAAETARFLRPENNVEILPWGESATCQRLVRSSLFARDPKSLLRMHLGDRGGGGVPAERQ